MLLTFSACSVDLFLVGCFTAGVAKTNAFALLVLFSFNGIADVEATGLLILLCIFSLSLLSSSLLLSLSAANILLLCGFLFFTLNMIGDTGCKSSLSFSISDDSFSDILFV